MTSEKDAQHTILVAQFEAAAKSGRMTSDQYKGLPIYALDGLHAFVATQIRSHCSPGAQILDVAAGSGAMTLRLADAGYRPTAVDIVPENFRPNGGIPFVVANLNEDFAKQFQTKFDAVVAIEIIEHLENPRHFIRQCRDVLRPGGRLFLSTPNIVSPASLAFFVRTGMFRYFTESNYEQEGHITPMPPHQIQNALGEARFVTLSEETFGDAMASLNGSPRLKFLARALRAVSNIREALHGDIYLVVAEKPLDSKDGMT